MYLTYLKIENFRLFKRPIDIHFNKGLNLLVGENGCGKSTVIDAIRALLNESEFAHKGISYEDFNFNCRIGEPNSSRIFVAGLLDGLSDEQKIEYLTWLTPQFSARLNVEYLYSITARNTYKQKRWGGVSSNSAFDWETLNDIQCVYLPPLRDAERYLRAGRGSRLARLLTALSFDELKDKRIRKEKMPLETEFSDFNRKIEQETDVKRANDLINESLKEAGGSVFGQSISIRFNEMSYERIVESLQLLFADKLDVDETTIFNNLCENSLGYNNLIYIATILAEFEGLKDKYTSPRILLVEELEAHLHPQLQIKLLKYLSKQADEYDIQVIITTHSTTLAASVSINKIISFNRLNGQIAATSLSKCEIESKSENFINRWLDATKSTLLFSKGNILVEGLAEAILTPKLAEIYLSSNGNKKNISSLEEAGISVINMNGIFFQHFMQLYNGYRIIEPQKQSNETDTKYKERLSSFVQKASFCHGEFKNVACIGIKCVAITDNDPASIKKEITDAKTGKVETLSFPEKPTKKNPLDGANPQLYYREQLSNMTDNCKVFSNLKTFEYDLAIESHYNAGIMLEIIMGNITTNGKIKESTKKYIDMLEREKTGENVDINDSEMALFILEQVDSSYLGKGLFAQLLYEKIDSNFVVPGYICQAIDFVLSLEKKDG